MRSVGLGLRLPFFLLGFALMTAYASGFGALSALWFFVAVPVIWALVRVPATFIKVSFRGKGTDELTTRIEHDVNEWRRWYSDHFQQFPDGYNALTRWLTTGSMQKSP
jgi:hypothetical protein